MQVPHLNTIVIVGGGTAGWMTATALATALRGRYRIRLVESDEIGIVGVGEATIPMIQRFNTVAGIEEAEFLKATNGTFKLGVEFVNWGRRGDRYMHGFGRLGQDLWMVGFEQYWHKMRALGKARDLADYSITRAAARANKFMLPRTDLGNSPLAEITYAYHFDAGLYARHLRKLSESRGVERIEGKIVRATQRVHDGHVDAVVMENGDRIEGDLFIDCSGFRGLLIEQTLATGYEDWSHWLPCDRALAVPCESVPVLTPYTRATAHQAGWQWRIPLQNRIGNGHVYCSRYISDDEAAHVLLSNLDGKPLGDPRPIRFTTGMRKKAWEKNVVAIGLSSGFLEPIESTSIHMIQDAIQRLLDYFPDQGFSQPDVDAFNRLSRFHYERTRDFIILHYYANQRDDAEFWRACAHMEIPAALREKIDLFRTHGRLRRVDSELFTEVGWQQVLVGQNIHPQAYHPLVDVQSEEGIQEYMDSVADVIRQCVDYMPDHAAFIAEYCKAPPM
ncbi:tryptophan 7-halogenase [Massilia pinisoli]|uniref:Tryptophan 7-halogenase n=1 Tax=Massilia pinisoli TaxID=1772194 RepID=A0ABT1ZVT6_9BURK|nr:tryptophan halogenase family protein [Massilia pinisoli]MCS0584060.1 tryptophan 7-halogenase [Massilia pinisoli]